MCSLIHFERLVKEVVESVLLGHPEDGVDEIMKTTTRALQEHVLVTTGVEAPLSSRAYLLVYQHVTAFSD